MCLIIYKKDWQSIAKICLTCSHSAVMNFLVPINYIKQETLNKLVMYTKKRICSYGHMLAMYWGNKISSGCQFTCARKNSAKTEPSLKVYDVNRQLLLSSYDNKFNKLMECRFL